MASSNAASETPPPIVDAHFITVDDVITPEQLLRSRERLITSFLLYNGRSNEEISELFNIYRSSSGETRAMCAALEEHLVAVPFMAAREPIANSAARAHMHQVQAEATLRSLYRSSGEKLRRINLLKNASLVFFTAAAAISSGMATLNAARWQEAAAATPATAAALVFGTLGGWFHSCLKKREGAEEKRREITGLMILDAKIAIDDLNDIRLCASEMSEIVGDEQTLRVRERTAALMIKLRELLSDYRGDTRCCREFVVDTIIKHFNY